MKGKIRLGFMIFMLLNVFTSTGQVTFQPKQSDFQYKGFVYNNERAFDIRIHTNGFDVGMNFGKLVTYTKTTFNHFSIGYINDRREKKQNKNVSLPQYSPSSSFIYGKQNNMIVLRAGKGVKRYMTDKSKRQGIAIGYSYEFGPSLAILKPYQLDLIYLENEDQPVYSLRSEPYTEENADKFLDFNSIYGGSGYFKGFDKLKLIPGLQANIAMVFSLGAYEKVVKSVQVGIMADVYIKKVPIMIETDAISNKPYFINLYLNLQLGSRTN